MFNKVVLDVAIGIVFIFLLYSLLATSIQEAIATALALRARTLRDGIINGMLSNTPNYSQWKSIAVGVWCFIKNIVYLIIGKPAVSDKNLGQLFYDHPLIKNYGSSRIFPNPSYLPTSNFSSILIDVLKQDFDNKIDAISKSKSQGQTGTTLSQIKQNLQNSTDAVKLKELLSYYGYFHMQDSPVPSGVIDKDTWQILQMYLRNSLYNINDFTKKLELWFDDSMDRVAGWYKRDVQIILFIIGLTIAIVFNVDIIQIESKLSTDKDARDQMVQLAIKEANAYKDDPRVQKLNLSVPKDSAKSDSIFKEYNQHINDAKRTIDTGIVKANQIMAIGWGDYGEKKDSAQILYAYFNSANSCTKEKRGKLDSIKKVVNTKIKALTDSAENQEKLIKKRYATKKGKLLNQAKYKTYISKIQNQLKTDTGKIDARAKADTDKIREELVHNNYTLKSKTGFVFKQLWSLKKLLGLLITAFAICLGAPFWFDLLSKLINLRAAGKKEDGSNNAATTGNKNQAKAQTPVTVTVNTQQSGEEAVG